jgi:hypothetical protein
MRTGIFHVMPLPAITAVQLVPPDPQRVALLLSPPSAPMLTITVAPQRIDSAAQGFCMLQGSSPMELTWERHGSLVRQAWWGFASMATAIALVDTRDDG